jgi:hypothetical protein
MEVAFASGAATPTTVPFPVGFHVTQAAPGASVESAISPGIRDELILILNTIPPCPAARRGLHRRQVPPMCPARLASFAQAVSQDAELGPQFDQPASAMASQMGLPVKAGQMLTFDSGGVTADIISILSPALTTVSTQILGIFAAVIFGFAQLAKGADNIAWKIDAGLPSAVQQQLPGQTAGAAISPTSSLLTACSTETNWVRT